MSKKFRYGLWAILALMLLGAVGVAAAQSAATAPETAEAPAQHPHWPHARGKIGHIVSLTSDSFTLNTLHGGALTVRVDAQTRYRVQDVDAPTLDDFAVDDLVLVVGRRTGTGEGLARLVVKVPEDRPVGRPLLGEITAIDGQEISLTRFNGDAVTVRVDDETHFRVGSDREAALDDFAPGDRVAVYGARVAPDDPATFAATHVMRRATR